MDRCDPVTEEMALRIGRDFRHSVELGMIPPADVQILRIARLSRLMYSGIEPSYEPLPDDWEPFHGI